MKTGPSWPCHRRVPGQGHIESRSNLEHRGGMWEKPAQMDGRLWRAKLICGSRAKGIACAFRTNGKSGGAGGCGGRGDNMGQDHGDPDPIPPSRPPDPRPSGAAVVSRAQ